MIQQMSEQQEMFNQMFVESLRQLEEDVSYESEYDPFKPLDLSNIEKCPYEFQCNV